jgi:hypothetical protein
LHGQVERGAGNYFNGESPYKYKLQDFRPSPLVKTGFINIIWFSKEKALADLEKIKSGELSVIHNVKYGFSHLSMQK